MMNNLTQEQRDAITMIFVESAVRSTRSLAECEGLNPEQKKLANQALALLLRCMADIAQSQAYKIVIED